MQLEQKMQENTQNIQTKDFEIATLNNKIKVFEEDFQVKECRNEELENENKDLET